MKYVLCTAEGRCTVCAQFPLTVRPMNRVNFTIMSGYKMTQTILTYVGIPPSTSITSPFTDYLLNRIKFDFSTDLGSNWTDSVTSDIVAPDTSMMIRGSATASTIIHLNTNLSPYLTKVEWGTKPMTRLVSAFADCTNLTEMIDSPVLSGPSVDMRRMFMGATSFNVDIGGWDVSNAYSMEEMFSGATAFNADLSGWDVGSVGNMSYMFYGATSFNSDISAWDVGLVVNMTGMFSGATSFNNGGQPLDWGGKTINVVGMKSMFSNAESFNQDVSGWDVTNVTDMSSMFFGASAFNNGGQPLGWGAKTGNVTDMSLMFMLAALFNQDISGWDVSKVTTMESMFYSATNFNYDLSSWSEFITAPEPAAPYGFWIGSAAESNPLAFTPWEVVPGGGGNTIISELPVAFSTTPKRSSYSYQMNSNGSVYQYTSLGDVSSYPAIENSILRQLEFMVGTMDNVSYRVNMIDTVPAIPVPLFHDPSGVNPPDVDTLLLHMFPNGTESYPNFLKYIRRNYRVFASHVKSFYKEQINAGGGYEDTGASGEMLLKNHNP